MLEGRRLEKLCILLCELADFFEELEDNTVDNNTGSNEEAHDAEFPEKGV